MALFPQFPSGEFTPLFRLLDDYASHSLSRPGSFGSTSMQTFQPRFDVKENKDSYELHGELPGIEQKNINIEFTDAQTLQISGRTEHTREEGIRPGEQAKITAPKPASVEDDTTTTDAGTQVANTSSSSNNTGKQVSKKSSATGSSDADAKHGRYWVSERSVGEFQRTFNFPTRLDQDNVKASLKNGVLTILVPKATTPVTKKIHIG